MLVWMRTCVLQALVFFEQNLTLLSGLSKIIFKNTMLFWIFSFLVFLNLLKVAVPNAIWAHSSYILVPKSWMLLFYFLFLLTGFWTFYPFSSLTLMRFSVLQWQLCCSGIVLVWCLCYRKLFSSCLPERLKAQSAPDILGHHFHIRLLSWETRQHTRENYLLPSPKVLHLQPMLACSYADKYNKPKVA